MYVLYIYVRDGRDVCILWQGLRLFYRYIYSIVISSILLSQLCCYFYAIAITILLPLHFFCDNYSIAISISYCAS